MILLGSHLFEIAIRGVLLFAPFIYCQSSRLPCISAYSPRLNALQCSQVGRLLPSPQALCLCVLSALLCCQTRRLVIQSGWRGVAVQIRPVLKELLLHAAPYVGWDWLPAYRRRTFASLQLFSPVLSISLHSPSNSPYLLVPPSTIRLTYVFPSSLQLLLILLPSGYLQQLLCQILLLSSIRGCRYKWMFSLFAASAANYICFIFRNSKDRVKIVEPAAMLGTPLCIIGSHFCLSDCSACFSYGWESRLTDESDRKHMCTLHGNKHFKH